MSEHPTYPFPVIREVICEIHFRLDKEWENTIYSQYFKTVEEQFPSFQPVTVAVELKSNAGNAIFFAPQVIRYQHSTRNLLLQLSENRIAVNVLPTYPGWSQVKEDIRFAWSKLNTLIKPVEVTRIGLRYINGIEKSSIDETLEKWLNPTDYIPRAAIVSGNGFVCQISTRIDLHNRVQVVIADQRPSNNDHGMFIFDIDRILEESIATDVESLLKRAHTLHEDVWNIFANAKTDDLEKLLKGELI